MSSTVIDYQRHPDAPVPGAAKVWWRIENEAGAIHWTHKGWLMPAVVRDDCGCPEGAEDKCINILCPRK